jgi:hypothetical protein
MTTALAQTTLGLLQLYGFEDSYHGLFKLTGGFHNPGPYSGFVVSALPLALACYRGLSGNGIKTASTTKYDDGTPIESHPVETNKPSNKWLGSLLSKWLKNHASISGIIRYSLTCLSIATIAAILLVLPAAQSRGAWVAGLAGCLFVMWSHPAFIRIRTKIFDFLKAKSLMVRITLTMIALMIVMGLASGLYYMKQGSANGRFLMWQVTAQLIQERPLTGHGTGAFEALYMTEQGNWFETGKGTPKQALVAGTPDAPFNELLKLWLEKGALALLLVAGMLWAVFVGYRKSPKAEFSSIREQNIATPDKKYVTFLIPDFITGFKGALLTLLVFSLFSYPFNISPFVLQLVVVVAILAGTTQQIVLIKRPAAFLMGLPVALLLILALYSYIPQRKAHYEALKTWQAADQLYANQLYHDAVLTYQEALPTLNTSGLFLQMYGKALNMDQQHQKSNEILTLAAKRFSNQIICNTLGDNHKVLGNFAEAEAAYQTSAQMVPSLLLPRYLLAKLYEESGQHLKAKQTAQEILNSPVKVESSATKQIMNEMRAIINGQ